MAKGGKKLFVVYGMGWILVFLSVGYSVVEVVVRDMVWGMVRSRFVGHCTQIQLRFLLCQW